MRCGLSFLATDRSQIPLDLGRDVVCLEAVIFDRATLDEVQWQVVWENIRYATTVLEPTELTFHFPVNDCDYINDSFVRDRLREAYSRACDLGLGGVVVHANNVYSVELWKQKSVESARHATLEALIDVSRGNSAAKTWLGLENMPAMDNHGDQIDPSFVFPSDFEILRGSGVGVTWDVCHFFNAIESCDAVSRGLQPRGDFPNLQFVDRDSFVEISDLIVHWHFSAFRGVPDRRRGIACTEGMLPWEGTLSEEVYCRALRLIRGMSREQRCIFEIQEVDYHQRINGQRILRWAETVGLDEFSSEEIVAA